MFNFIIHIMVNWELSKQGICWAESHDRLGTQVPTLHKFCCCCCCFVLSFLDFLLTLSWRVISFRLITGLSERKASIQFSLNLILISTSGDVWLHSISTLEIRKEGTSLFYSRVEWTSAFKGFFQVYVSAGLVLPSSGITSLIDQWTGGWSFTTP